MIEDKELKIIQQLRANAREKLTQMSRRTGIPVSTIFEKLKIFEQGVIYKHTCLLDFRELGYDLRLTLLVKTRQETKQEVKQFLESHHQVNTVYRINNGYDYLAEVLFKNMKGVQGFLDALDIRGVTSRKEYYVLEELRREAFLTSQAHQELLRPT